MAPARNHTVVGQNHDTAQYAQSPEYHPEAPAERLNGTDRRFLRRAAQKDLGHHDGKTDASDTSEVNQNEGSTSVLTRDVRKFPDVSKTHRRAGSRKNETQLRAPMPSIRHLGDYK